MTSADFETRLKQLEQDVLSLGDMAEKAIEGSVEGLRKRDLGLAKQIIEGDQEIDRRRLAIEQDCIRLLSSGHFRDGDLRMIVGTLVIATELERIGDYAHGIAKIALLIGHKRALKRLVDIPRMAQIGIEMLRGSLEAFVERDAQKAKRISEKDDEVDALHDQVYRELLLIMIEHPRTITRATWLLWAAHNLERFADRVTNICERVVYSVTGEMVDIGASKY